MAIERRSALCRTSRCAAWYILPILLIVLLEGADAVAGTETLPTNSGPTPALRPAILDRDTRIDVNSISMFVTNFGSFGYNLARGDGGLEYPKGSGKMAVFAAGLWVGGKVDGDVRLAAAEYASAFRPGAIENGAPSDSADAANRVYKIARGDGPANPDWREWPAAAGAPLDAAGQPAVLGDQTLWAVYNDLGRIDHTLLTTAPLGIEVQQTTFAYKQEDVLSSTVFIRFLITNKGGARIDSTYVSIWSDPDLGGASDDLVGCDVRTNLGFVYNGSDDDYVCGAEPPCVGFDLLKGPAGDDGALLPMTSFSKYIGGTDPQNPGEAYNLLKGIDMNSKTTWHLDPAAGQIAAIALTGDPVKGTGWLDSYPADRRLMVSSGPFTFAPGDTQEVVAAIVVGQGRDRLKSITSMRYLDAVAQAVFESGFEIPGPLDTSITVPPVMEPPLPTEFDLGRNYPNPFNASTTVAYDIAELSYPRLLIYDSAGRRIRTLVDGIRQPGRYTADWDGCDDAGRNAASGIYICQMEVLGGGFAQSRRMVLAR